MQKLQGPDAQAMIDRTKGRVSMTADMKPGDVLYIPRGFYHDALASSQSSLHLTFAVAPLDGRILFRMIEDLAIRDPDFREHLPDHRDDDGAALQARLRALAAKVAALIGSELVAIQVAAWQRGLAVFAPRVDPAAPPTLAQWVRTQAPAHVEWDLGGPMLSSARGKHALGVMAQAVEWAIGQASFWRLQLATRFAWLNEKEVQQLLDWLSGTGLFVRNDRPS